ncbi:MAG: cytochrome c oxidase subunit II [candidate division KSB1 bacterium]|nr:cytochrome c oxidase subunit II [candidate division KSB1 bacterium]MDZ7399591.1 cytochrome c oxidase subunit II [candidate division KSB1 bacterium]
MIVDTANIPQTVNNVFYLILAISVVLLLLITFLMVFFVIKYHRKRNKEPKDIEGNTWLEITWTVIPTILVLGMFYYGWIGYKMMKDVPKDAMTINVTGRMWSWLFEYENGIQSDTLYVPVDKPIRINLKSQDVLHSFYIPAFRVKHDVVPGNEQGYVWFQPKELGTYDVFCAEYCGQQHAYMKTKLVVLPETDFQAWLSKKGGAAPAADSVAIKPMTTSSSAEPAKTDAPKEIPRGLALLNEKQCTACHSLDGSLLVATTFKGIFGRKQIVLTDGKERRITIDEAYFKKSILEPNADVVKGFDPIMPETGGITEGEIREMMEYVKGLK